MRVIVPLAGPDFIRADGSLKALHALNGEPLLRHVLGSRAWVDAVTSYSFVLLDRPETRAFATGPLADWFPGASTTYISHYTRGAALSALAALPQGTDFTEPLIIDLADILYEATLDPAAMLAGDAGLGGIALTFPSDNPAYSYLATDDQGRFVEAAEKRVISEHASAGTYIFRDAPTYLRSLAHGLENESSQTFRDLFFVCPLFNGVRDQGKSVALVPVENVTDIKMEP